ncbi:MAG: histidine--tRNA ligase [Methanobacteriota archaeon]|nr:MAG: histidine--tRNA ligase [Euryarchaeota archaeon]
MFERARGTRDFGPADMGRRLAFERLCDEVAARFGFARIATPTFERLELFTAKSGDAIVDQLYAFKDRSDRDLTLRPELTAPVMRMVAEQGGQMAKPARWCYYGSCFRYEESKAGRFREFWQYGCEIIGASGPLTEAEVVGFACSILDAVGLVDWELRVGNVGVLNDVLSGLALEGAAVGDAMRLLDKGDFDALAALGIDAAGTELLRALAGLEGGAEAIPRARDILTGMGITTSSLDDLEQMLVALAALAPAPPSLTVDFTVARGLDYYTGMVFEIDVAELGGEGQVCGGGSYNLLHLFGLEDLDPCCGFGLGFDRVLIALERQAERLGRAEVVPGESSGPGALAVIPFKVDPAVVLPLVGELRAAGEQVLLELRERNLGRSMSWADACSAEFALIVGPRDLEAGEATIKRLSDGEQRTTRIEAGAVISTLAELRD